MVDRESDGLQSREISLNECAVCFGLYEEDFDEVIGHVTAEWIQCTNSNCSVWSHADCLEKADGDYICVLCETVFC